MIGPISLLLSLAILYWVLKYRVHIHVTYTPLRGREPRRGSAKPRTGEDRPHQFAGSVPPSRPRISPRSIASDVSAAESVIHPESVVWGDISSALVNLGTPKTKARSIASKVCKEHAGEQSFEDLLRLAIQEAA
jgi:hypothetical protein